MTPFCVREFLRYSPVDGHNGLEDNLCHPVTVVDGERLITKIDEQYIDFSTIIRVNSAGSIKHSDAVFMGDTTSWPYLCLKTFGNSDVNSCRNQCPCEWCKYHRFIEKGRKVKP